MKGSQRNVKNLPKGSQIAPAKTPQAMMQLGASEKSPMGATWHWRPGFAREDGGPHGDRANGDHHRTPMAPMGFPWIPWEAMDS